MAAEATIRGALKPIQTGRPESFYQSIDDGGERLKLPTEGTLNNMSSKRSRTWQIRAQGWLNMVAEEARDWDMQKLSGKRKFRNWIKKIYHK